MLLLSLFASFIFGLDGALAYWSYEALNVSLWQWQSSVLVDKWLYIDGGELYAIQNGHASFFYRGLQLGLTTGSVAFSSLVGRLLNDSTVGQTISIDLSRNWTSLTVPQYAKETQRSTTDGHWFKQPSLFFDPSSYQVVQWGGWPYDDGDISKQFVFTPNNDGTVDWAEAETPSTNNDGNGTKSPAVFGAASVASNTSFYSLGGIVADLSSPPDTAVPGFVEFEFATGAWTNASSSAVTSNGYLVGAQMSYTPGSDQGGFGESGYLIVVGGNNPTTQAFDPESPQLVDMAKISLYDIGAKAWYHQSTTGTIPPPRQFFCSVAATSIQATFEIFILGGSTNSTYDQANANDTDYLDVFVLSIPAFRWFKAPSDPRNPVRRADHKCQLIDGSQMLVIGGSQPSNPLGIAAADPWPNGLGVFDISQFAWVDGYTVDTAPYQQPAAVRDYYTSEYQAPVWDEPALEPVFAWAPPDLPTGTYTGFYPSSTGEAASSSSSSTNAATRLNSSPASSGSNHKGAIIGGVIGGVAAVVILVAAILLYRRKQKSKRDARLREAAVAAQDNKMRGTETSDGIGGGAVFPKHELPSSEPSPGLVDEKKEGWSVQQRVAEMDHQNDLEHAPSRHYELEAHAGDSLLSELA